MGHAVLTSNWCLSETFWPWSLAKRNGIAQWDCILWSDRIFIKVLEEEGSSDVGLKNFYIILKLKWGDYCFSMSHLALLYYTKFCVALWSLVYPFFLFHTKYTCTVLNKDGSFYSKKKCYQDVEPFQDPHQHLVSFLSEKHVWKHMLGEEGL